MTWRNTSMSHIASEIGKSGGLLFFSRTSGRVPTLEVAVNQVGEHYS
jgi:hypothetical protein